jgi:hypothetical protein
MSKLMPRPEGRLLAVANNDFAIYPVANVNQALQLLTGELAGIKDKNGEYPEDSLNLQSLKNPSIFSLTPPIA